MKTFCGAALAASLLACVAPVQAQSNGWGQASTSPAAKKSEPAAKKPASGPQNAKDATDAHAPVSGAAAISTPALAPAEPERDRQIAGLERVLHEQAQALEAQQALLSAVLTRLAASPSVAVTAPAAPVAVPATVEVARPSSDVTRPRSIAPEGIVAVTPTTPVATRATGTSPATPAATLALMAAPAQTHADVVAPTPLTIRLGDADFLIGGFMDATAVTRTTNVGSGIGTAFASIPFSTTPQGNLGETRLSSQNSRISLQATSKVGDASVKGYIEADFLGAGPANQFVTSNANTLRMRLYWMQVNKGKLEFLGGQSWSFLTPNRKGVSPVPGDLFYGQVMDTNYQVGLTWARQTQFRLVAHPTGSVATGISIENPQQYVGGAVVLPASFMSSQVDASGNTATPNRYPDIVGKIAFDPTTGNTHQHIEVAGLLRGYKTTNTAATDKFSATGKGVSINVNLEPIRNLHLVGTSFLSQGGGRYIFGLGPDFIVNADGSLTLVNARSGIGGLELTAGRSLFYSYYGFAAFDRAVAVDTTGKPIGYGIPGSMAANRQIQEATLGLTQTVFREPRYGALQLMFQYSHLTRTPWDVPAGTPSQASSEMVWTNVRYVLP